MTKFIYKNQQLVNKRQATISIAQRGFLFGDGLFETCRISNSKIYNFSSHFERLSLGLKNINIDIDISNLEKKSLQLIQKNQQKNGILRISISRGIGSLGYLPKSSAKPLLIIETAKLRPKPKFISLGISSYQTPAQIFGKSMNSLPYILTKIQAKKAGFFDCVMLSQKDFVAETSSANIFWVKSDKIYTPSSQCQILEGCMRRRILEISPFKITQTQASLSDLESADEIFLSNSAFGILEVDEFLGKKLQKNWSKKFAQLIEKDLKNSCQN